MTIDAFISRWSNLEGGAERANYAMFLSELCDVIEVPRPDPASATTDANDYVFERHVRRADGSAGRIDLYRRGAFVLEAKQTRERVGGEKFLAAAQSQLALDDLLMPPAAQRRRGWDVLMVNARRQAEDYARELPQDHGWPPFVIVCDVGRCLEIYADFRRMGKYEQFPDRQGYRIALDDLRRPEVRERLKAIWLDPHSLDPASQAAKATREIAARLAAVSKALEKTYHPEEVAHFLMRCLFTMFAEDVGLLPDKSFLGLLEDCAENPAGFAPLLSELWRVMDSGGYATSIRAAVKRFNGALFKDAKVLTMGREEIGELRAAAAQDWREVEPAIFGTLLEQALEPAERKKLGAHYTPRAYVERLVTATIIGPLRFDWQVVLGTVEARQQEDDTAGAVAAVRAFHERLCATRVLDPACGTGNFLYVSLDLMKRLEAEVLDTLAGIGGQTALPELEGHTVGPQQFLGLELNPRAAAIAELVLWIGYLQLHFRNSASPPGEPILKAFGNINFGKPGGYNAVLTWDGCPVPRVEQNEAGERVETYPGARRPPWPQAEFIVGNPPFIGGKFVRDRLGDGEVEALWATHRQINKSADFVMYWWDRSAEILTQKGSVLRRFGLVTTNSITQEFNRRTIRKRMDGKTPISIVFAIPDHPWTKTSADAAAVRIAMTVVVKGAEDGVVRNVMSETRLDTDEPALAFKDERGRINADLSIGIHSMAAHPLVANDGVCSPGVKLHGAGFIISAADAELLGLGRRPQLDRHIRPYRHGRDIAAKPRGVMVIDLFGLTSDEVRVQFPEVYQHLLVTVKPERDRNQRDSYRVNWWIFGEARSDLRPALASIDRFIATPVTQKHRFFVFLDKEIIPDDALMVVASSDAIDLATLSSSVFSTWFRKNSSTLEDRPRFIKGSCFDPFPFPDCQGDLAVKLRDAGERLDSFRKQRQAEHPGLTLTQMYNVREALRAGRPLTPDEARIKDEGLILILNELHDEIDRLTFEAYGWPQGLSDEAILERLVALNAERAAEERRGHVRWLRPEYQKARAGVLSLGPEQVEADLGFAAEAGLRAFPRDPFEQSAAVAAALAAASGPIAAAQIAGAWRKDKRTEAKVAAILAAFVRTAFASSADGGRTFRARRAA